MIPKVTPNMTPNMTPEIAALVKSEKPLISPREAAKALHVTPYIFNLQLKQGMLPFPALKVGSRVKIPRIPFLRYLGYDGGTPNA